MNYNKYILYYYKYFFICKIIELICSKIYSIEQF